MNDWRVFRPAIWLGMLGVAILLLIQPAYFGVVLIGAAIGIAAKIETGRRRAARRANSAAAPARRARRR